MKKLAAIQLLTTTFLFAACSRSEISRVADAPQGAALTSPVTLNANISEIIFNDMRASGVPNSAAIGVVALEAQQVVCTSASPSTCTYTVSGQDYTTSDWYSVIVINQALFQAGAPTINGKRTASNLICRMNVSPGAIASCSWSVAAPVSLLKCLGQGEYNGSLKNFEFHLRGPVGTSVTLSKEASLGIVFSNGGVLAPVRLSCDRSIGGLMVISCSENSPISGRFTASLTPQAGGAYSVAELKMGGNFVSNLTCN